MQAIQSDWGENQYAVHFDGTLTNVMDERVPAGLVNKNTRLSTIYNFGSPDDLCSFALIIGQQGVSLNSSVVDNNTRKELGNVGNLLIRSSHVEIKKLTTAADFDELKKGDLIQVSDGTNAPPRHHKRKFRKWENHNFIGYFYEMDSFGRGGILIDQTGMGFIITRYGLSGLTFSKVTVNRP